MAVGGCVPLSLINAFNIINLDTLMYGGCGMQGTYVHATVYVCTCNSICMYIHGVSTHIIDGFM